MTLTKFVNFQLHKKLVLRSFFLFLPVCLALVLSLSTGAFAQSLNIDLGQAGTINGRVVQMILLLTILSLAPSILVMTTSFIRMIIVFSMLRTAMGTQQTPPNMVLVSLALFLTGYVMAPTLTAVWDTAIDPLINEQIDGIEAYNRGSVPLRNFMLGQVREKDLALFVDLSGEDIDTTTPDTVPMTTLIPAFMISEIRRAFEIGFLLYIPFIVIDMVVASILMSMGMMMLPPPMIAMPFKIIFFVMADGWNLIAGSLVQSFGTSPPPGVG